MLIYRFYRLMVAKGGERYSRQLGMTVRLGWIGDIDPDWGGGY